VSDPGVNRRRRPATVGRGRSRPACRCQVRRARRVQSIRTACVTTWFKPRSLAPEFAGYPVGHHVRHRTRSQRRRTRFHAPLRPRAARGSPLSVQSGKTKRVQRARDLDGAYRALSIWHLRDGRRIEHSCPLVTPDRAPHTRSRATSSDPVRRVIIATIRGLRPKSITAAA
jgi:hypothetical protein